MKRYFPAFISILFLVMTGCFSPQHHETSSEKIAVEPKDEFLDLGHGRIRFSVIRGNLPAIVLESGGGMDSSQWKSLQPEIARLTGLAVVSYDRPGFGESELPSSSYDATLEMQDLKAALKRLQLARKVILVGHSYGGMLNRLYASQNPRSVRGVILIDPNSVEYIDSQRRVRPAPKETPKSEPEPVPALKRIGVAWEKVIETVRPAAFRSDIPMVVITAGHPWSDEENNKLWRAAHEGMVAGNPNRSLVVAEGSGHIITADRPDLVLSTVTNIVARIQKHY